MQHQAQPPYDVDAFKAQIKEKNVVWVYTQNFVDSHVESFESFDDIESMALERKYKEYLNSKGDFHFQIVILGIYSVDLKSRLKFLSSDPDDPKKMHLVMRGHSHHRRRVGLPIKSRFTVGSDSDPMVKF